tara:strand:- start:546 stop:785 length:240 start_codon:yes stop_codon:yes gene_type:complete
MSLERFVIRPILPSGKYGMNMISELRRRIKANGHGTLLTVDEFNKLQAEWITRADITVCGENPVYDLQFKNAKPVTHQD